MTAIDALKLRIKKATEENNRKEMMAALTIYAHAHICMQKDDPEEFAKKFGKDVQKVVNSAVCTLNRNMISKYGGI